LALVASALSGCVAPGEATGTDAPRDVHVDLTLRDGGRIAGSAADAPLVLRTGREPTVVQLTDVRAIDDNRDGETVTLRTSDGASLRGVLETPTFDVLPTGSATRQTFAAADVSAVRVTPRIRIAGSGDAWWDLALTNALGFDVVNDDDQLTVHAIDPAAVNSGSHGDWSTVTLTRDTGTLHDFTLTAKVAWDACGAGERAMHNVYVTLVDVEGREIACTGQHDAWSATTGSRYSRVAGVPHESGYGTQPATGCAALTVVRKNGRVRVLWDGREVRQGSHVAPLARIVIQVDFYPYRGSDGSSVFGSIAVEHLSVLAHAVENAPGDG
jgi:hypothetical protein